MNWLLKPPVVDDSLWIPEAVIWFGKVFFNFKDYTQEIYRIDTF